MKIFLLKKCTNNQKENILNKDRTLKKNKENFIKKYKIYQKLFNFKNKPLIQKLMIYSDKKINQKKI